MKQLWRTGAIGAVACVLLSAGAGAQAETSPSAGSAGCRDVEVRCVIGGTTTLTLSPSWQRKLSAAGIRFHAIAPATQRGSQIVFPIARTHGPQYGPRYVGVGPSEWSIDGCNIAKGGAAFHRGRLVIVKGSSSVAAVNALVDGPRLTLESVDPRGGPGPVSLAFAFSGWKILAITAAGFRAHAQLRLRSSRGIAVPAGVVGSLSLDVRVSPKIAVAIAASCVGGPTESLPRVEGGPIYPLLAGSVIFGTPMQNLYSVLGRGQRCNDEVCRWEKGPDEVIPGSVSPVDGRAGVQVLLREITLKSSDVNRSRLKKWETPEGIHLGSTRADVVRAYPVRPSGPFNPIDTRPYKVDAGGRQTRQRFRVQFGPDKQQRVAFVAVRLHGEEGKCWVHWRHEQKLMNFQASCFGPLVAARLEPVGASPRFATDLQAGGAIKSAVDDAGVERYVLYVDPMAQGHTAPDRISWRVECVSSGPPRCAPGRGTGQTWWPAGAFEEWELTFDGYSARAAPKPSAGAGPKIPPMRFVAEFLGLPPFTIVISRAY